MGGKLRTRFWVNAILSSVSGGLLILTLAWHDWIEGVFGVDPDGHNGSVEWLICAGLFLASVISFLAARRDWRAARVAVTGTS